MKQWEAHFAAAEQAMQASRTLEAGGQPVPAAFFACHAFEMAGGAFLVSVGEGPSRDPKRRSHEKTVRHFAVVAGRYGFGHRIGAVATRVAALRDECLYAHEAPERGWQPPSERVSGKVAAQLVSRVAGILDVVREELPQ